MLLITSTIVSSASTIVYGHDDAYEGGSWPLNSTVKAPVALRGYSYDRSDMITAATQRSNASQA